MASESAPALENVTTQDDRSGGRGRGGAGRGRTPGRGGRGLWQPDARGTPGRGGGGLTSIAPTTGIPYGYVPGYLPGSSSLVEELDERVLIVLRDGRHLVGMLRSFDQFSNMVLDDASERKVHRDSNGVIYFSDVPLGVYIVRGDSMVMMGQISPDQGMQKVDVAELEEIMARSKMDPLEWDFDKDLMA